VNAEMQRHSRTLGSLTHEDLARSPAWEATGEVVDGDGVLVPVLLDPSGRVPTGVGEVWCRSRCRFANGGEHPACAMYRGDSEEGPLAWTVWNGDRDVPLLLPPAPPHVLALDGPEAFARAFHLSLDAVFPLTIESDCDFEEPPRRRRVLVDPFVATDA